MGQISCPLDAEDEDLVQAYVVQDMLGRLCGPLPQWYLPRRTGRYSALKLHPNHGAQGAARLFCYL